MTVHIYSSDDFGAPSLTNTSGSLAALFKACLVGTGGTAYGAKASAGWTCEIDNTNDILLRNSATDGSGTYYRIKDDGYQQTTQVAANYGLATITGAKGYTSISELITPYPRTITGSERHSNTYYGVPWAKASSASLPTTWKIVADSTTCYFFCKHGVTVNNSFGANSISDPFTYAYGFGDLGLLANVVTNPKGFVSGDRFNGWAQALFQENDYDTVGFMEHPLTGGSQSTRYMTRGSVGVMYRGSPPSWRPITIYDTMTYPSPITGGAVFEPIFILDDTNNVVRTDQHTVYGLGLFAKYKGIYSCNHSIGSAAGCIGAMWDIVQSGGRDYLLMVLPGYYVNEYSQPFSFAIDITGPWT